MSKNPGLQILVNSGYIKCSLVIQLTSSLYTILIHLFVLFAYVFIFVVIVLQKLISIYVVYLLLI